MKTYDSMFFSMTRSSGSLRNLVLAGPLLFSSIAAADSGQILLDVAMASATHNIVGEAPAVRISFSPESRRAFGAFSSRHVGQLIEVRLRDEVLTSAVLQTPILGGAIIVAGGASDDDAVAMARRLSSPGTKIEVRAIGR